jgi:CelD/BcsL family acetyltransferase involved in cellulose biosynthesis
MKVELIPVPELSPAVECAWRELASRALEPNPFAEADFVLPAARHLGAAVALLTVSDGEDLRACTPVRRVWRWRKVPVPAIVSWHHRYCFLGTPLLDRDRPASAVDAIVHDLRKSAGAARLFALEWVDVGEVLAELEAGAARAGRPTVRLESFARPLLDRDGAAPHVETLGAETSKRLARRRRALIRDHGPAQTVVVEPDESSVERFLAIEASGWKGEQGTALASRAEDAAFFREVCGRFASRGRLELRSLELADGASIAMSCRLRAGDGMFCFKVGHDEQYRKYAPGNQIEVDTMDQLEGSPEPHWIDSCSDPDNDFFGRLFPERRTLTTVVLPAGRFPGPALVKALPVARRWWQTIGRRKEKDAA